MSVFKVIVAGSRDFNDYDLLKQKCDALLANKLAGGQAVEIVSGGARGADKLGEQYAAERHLPLTIFKANWTDHGKQAGYLRNAEMADYADALIAFDFGTKGTGHMINLAKSKNLHVRVIRVTYN